MGSSRKSCFYWGGDKSMNLYARSCGEFILQPLDREARIVADFAEIFWAIDGEGAFKIGRDTYTLYPGSVWYYPPGVLQDYRPVTEFHYCWLTLAGSDCRKFLDIFNIKPGLNRAGICPTHLFRQIENDMNFFSESRRRSILATAAKILSLVSVDSAVNSSRGYDLAEIKSYIENNCGDTDLSVAKIAAEYNMHRGSLSRAFHKTFGVTISDCISNFRMKRAGELLTQTHCTVAEIAVACGMTSAHYFSKVFTRKTGVTPSEFRNRFKSYSQQ